MGGTFWGWRVRIGQQLRDWKGSCRPAGSEVPGSCDERTGTEESVVVSPTLNAGGNRIKGGLGDNP
ncbi:hypothetical protein CGRA01v4_02257 [Colletotrichum graminicola]|nr:hypothetical protein CGRA01v4_02257 [Colletotrichum graminicola]